MSIAAVVAASIMSSDAAEARHHHYYARHVAAAAPRAHHRPHIEAYAPPTASIVVDANTGAVLQAANAEAPRHPASLTKIMTLYLLFERLDAGKIRLDSPLKISGHAAEQAPTKLGLKPGQSIAVEDAIKAVVTKSANDAAVAIAENLGGGEEEFAGLMTEKARALGMTRTTYVNASGLPNDDQITTAQDQALLGRAIQERFPRYYRYFSTEQFVYRGHAMRNHNHLLGVVGGVDGIKTGYTHASGFNLVTSVHRDGRYIIAVVLGGRSAPERDAHMRELINAHIKEASLHHSAPAITEKPASATEVATANVEKVTPNEPKPVAFNKTPLSSHTEPVAPAATANGGDNAAAAANDPIKPLLVRTIPYRTAPLQTASMAPMPPLVPATPPQQPPATSTRPAPAPQPAEAQTTVVVSSAAPVAIAPSSKTDAVQPEPAKPDAPKPETANAERVRKEPAAKPVHIHSGWIVQIGAFEGEDEARQHLSEAQAKIPAMLGKADSFTERVQKGDKALYRARFAGFDKASAETICRRLKRSEIACMTVKD